MLGTHRPAEERHGAERALPSTRPLEGPSARHRGAAADVVAGCRPGSSPGLRQADPASGALRSMPAVVPAHEVRAGRRHGGHGSTMLPSASERLDSLGRRAGGGRLHSLLGNLGAEVRHLSSDRGACRRGDSIPAERSRPDSPGARILAPHVERSLPRNARGLRPLTCGPVLEAPAAEARAWVGIGSGRTRWRDGGRWPGADPKYTRY